MKLINKLLRLLIVVLIAALYCTALWLGTTEESRRMLNIDEPRPQGDFVLIDITVTAVDTARGLLSVRIRPIPMGTLGIDRNTPSRDLSSS